MKKLSKMVLLLGSVFMLALFAGCSNGSDSESSEPDTLLAGKGFSHYFDGEGEDYTGIYVFNTNGTEFKYIIVDDEVTVQGTYSVSDGEIGAERTVIIKYIFDDGDSSEEEYTIPAGLNGWIVDDVYCMEDGNEERWFSIDEDNELFALISNFIS